MIQKMNFLRIKKKFWICNLALLAFIDLLFFPYFQVIIIPFSLPMILTVILLMGKASFPPTTRNAFFVMAGLMIASAAIGIFLPHSAPYAAENFKRVIQFLSSFLYLIFFFYVALNYSIENTLKTISLVFLAYFLVLLSWFFFDPIMVNAMMSKLYGRIVTSQDVVLSHFRFAYQFSDPNTAGYFVLIAVLPWLPLYKSTTIKTIIVALCFVAALFVQSQGVVLALILAVLLWIFPWRWLRLRFRGQDIWFFLKIFTIAPVIGTVMAFVVFKYFGDIQIFDMSLRRVYDLERYSRGGSRFEIWWSYVSVLIPLPIGSGYKFDTPYGQFFPHSDLLRLIYSYGFIVAGVFVWWVFKKGWRYPLLLIPALMAFAINSLIDEQKLFGLFLAILGIFIGRHQREGAFRIFYPAGDKTVIR